MVLTAYFVLSPVIGLFCHRRPRFSSQTRRGRGVVRPTRLPRPQDSALVFGAARVHRIPPRVRDVRNAPLWDRTAAVVEVICPTGEAKYFCKWGWTANSLICPSGK